jgi:hypothetical protein
VGSLQWGDDPLIVEMEQYDENIKYLFKLQCGHDPLIVEVGPPRGRLQNSGLLAPPREGIAPSPATAGSDFGGDTDLLAS